MAYWLKYVGETESPLSVLWWTAAPEILTAVYFSARKYPKGVTVGNTLIYYAVGRGKIVGVATVMGLASEAFDRPKHWSLEKRRRFTWAMPVEIAFKCPCDARAPDVSEFYPYRLRQQSLLSLTDEQGEDMSAAIKSTERDWTIGAGT
jgi:hypothetical protein